MFLCHSLCQHFLPQRAGIAWPKIHLSSDVCFFWMMICDSMSFFSKNDLWFTVEMSAGFRDTSASLEGVQIGMQESKQAHGSMGDPSSCWTLCRPFVSDSFNVRSHSLILWVPENLLSCFQSSVLGLQASLDSSAVWGLPPHWTSEQVGAVGSLGKSLPWFNGKQAGDQSIWIP